MPSRALRHRNSGGKSLPRHERLRRRCWYSWMQRRQLQPHRRVRQRPRSTTRGAGACGASARWAERARTRPVQPPRPTEPSRRSGCPTPRLRDRRLLQPRPRPRAQRRQPRPWRHPRCSSCSSGRRRKRSVHRLCRWSCSRSLRLRCFRGRHPHCRALPQTADHQLEAAKLDAARVGAAFEARRFDCRVLPAHRRLSWSLPSRTCLNLTRTKK